MRTTTRHQLQLVTYLDRSLRDVVAGFERDDVDDVVRAGVATVLGEGAAVAVHVDRPVWLTTRSAVVPVRWGDDTTSVRLVVVQTGAEPMTEVIVVLDVGETDTATAHLVFDAVAERLVA